MTFTIRLFRSDRACLALVLPVAALLFAIALGGHDLWAPDEPRSGVIVREILETGSWAVLHENGRPYVEKPPLYYWLAALASRPAGAVSELSLRLPSSLAALAGVVLVFVLGRDLFGRRTGALAALVIATVQGYAIEARWAHPDMLWSVCLLAACTAFWKAHRPGGDRRALVFFHGVMGLAVLAKGPLGILLPILAIVAYLAASRDLASLRHAGLAWGLPFALLPAALWLLAWGVAAGEAFPLATALERIGVRFTEGVHHARPFLHIVTSLPLEFLPWTLLLPGAILHTLPRRGARGDRAIVYLYAWIIVLVAIFGLSAEKRAVYLLPLLPFLAILVARLWDTSLMGWDPSPVGRGVAAAFSTGLVLTVAAGGVVLARRPREAPALVVPAIVLAGAAAATTLTALLVQSRAGAGAGLAAFTAGAVVCLLVVFLAV
ncbi:MAG TPA: glycosyltransferase family 39 protein, partial [Methylomirabilota bacterium]|nr:glycosyltransferase family 39 protein [Methylomirabilota bacterium]